MTKKFTNWQEFLSDPEIKRELKSYARTVSYNNPYFEDILQEALIKLSALSFDNTYNHIGMAKLIIKQKAVEIHRADQKKKTYDLLNENTEGMQRVFNEYSLNRHILKADIEFFLTLSESDKFIFTEITKGDEAPSIEDLMHNFNKKFKCDYKINWFYLKRKKIKNLTIQYFKKISC